MTDSSDTSECLKKAIFDRLTTEKTFSQCAATHSVSEHQLKRAWKQWTASFPESQPQCADDIQFTLRAPGKPVALTKDEEDLIASVTDYYISIACPLTKTDMLDMVQDVLNMLPDSRKENIPFKDCRPSNGWLKGFIRRYPQFKLSRPRQCDDKRVTALTRETVAQHIARVDAAMKRFNIQDPRFVFNLDECGISFKESGRRGKAKAIGRRGRQLLTTTVQTQNIDHVTVMGVVNAAGFAFKPACVFPGKRQHYQRVNGKTEGLLTHLMPCYLYKRDPAGDDSAIFSDWASQFIEEVKQYRPAGQNVLMIYDGYKCHIQYRVLKRFRENGIYVISLPSHTSHVLQPLDSTVFGPFKAHFTRHLHSAARVTSRLNPFQVARLVTLAYSDAFSVSNIQSGFENTGIWDRTVSGPTTRLLEHLPFYTGDTEGSSSGLPTLADVVERFNGRSRSLLRDVQVEDTGVLNVVTRYGAHLTAESLEEAFEKSLQKKRAAREAEEARAQAERQRKIFPEKPDELRRLALIGQERKKRRAQLSSSRELRRSIKRARSVGQGSVSYTPLPNAPTDSDADTDVG